VDSAESPLNVIVPPALFKDGKLRVTSEGAFAMLSAPTHSVRDGRSTEDNRGTPVVIFMELIVFNTGAEIVVRWGAEFVVINAPCTNFNEGKDTVCKAGNGLVSREEKALASNGASIFVRPFATRGARSAMVQSILSKEIEVKEGDRAFASL
jgi:hypothetical protein